MWAKTGVWHLQRAGSSGGRLGADVEQSSLRGSPQPHPSAGQLAESPTSAQLLANELPDPPNVRWLGGGGKGLHGVMGLKEGGRLQLEPLGLGTPAA